MISGACNCGAIAFEASTKMQDIYVCHCSICRKWSGANGMAIVIVPKTAFRYLRGRDLVTVWKKPGADWESHFCPTCGSSLPGENDAERMFIPAGLIAEGDNELKVAAHIFVNSKAAWDEIGDDGVCYAGAFGSSKKA